MLAPLALCSQTETPLISTGGQGEGCHICKDVKRFLMDGKNNAEAYANSTFVVLVTEKGSDTGYDMFVYARKAGNKGDTLEMDVKKGQLLQLNEAANFFYGLYGNYLFVDNGTGSQNRRVKVYDLTTGKKIIEDTYFDGEFEFDGKTLSFWAAATDKKKEKVCPGKYQVWESGGNGTAVVEKIKIDIVSLKKTRTGKFECRMTE